MEEVFEEVVVEALVTVEFPLEVVLTPVDVVLLPEEVVVAEPLEEEPDEVAVEEPVDEAVEPLLEAVAPTSSNWVP